MACVAAAAKRSGHSNRAYALGLARAFAGAVIFSLPLLMTMEMWWFGFTMEPLRLLQFMLLNFLILIGLTLLNLWAFRSARGEPARPHAAPAASSPTPASRGATGRRRASPSSATNADS